MFDPKLLPRLKGPVTFTLDSGVELHEESPDTFELPSEEERTCLRPRQFAKLIFRMTDGENVAVERMWVMILAVTPDGYRGMLDNHSDCTQSIGRGLIVDFRAEHIIQIHATMA